MAEGRCVTWDVTVVDTYAKSYIRQTCSCVGAVAERAVSRRVEKYSFLYRSHAGVWCAEDADFMNEIGRCT